ncbi:unnamed protein product [Closterium sp. NIES-54]
MNRVLLRTVGIMGGAFVAVSVASSLCLRAATAVLEKRRAKTAPPCTVCQGKRFYPLVESNSAAHKPRDDDGSRLGIDHVLEFQNTIISLGMATVPSALVSAASSPRDSLVLLLMKGHPGSGKSTLARSLARSLRWPLIDKDVFRDATMHLERSDGPCAAPVDARVLNSLSYDAMWQMAEVQLDLGLSVVVDCPLAHEALFKAGVALGTRVGAEVALIECHVSDLDTWKRRIESRAAAALSDDQPSENAGNSAESCRPSAAAAAGQEAAAAADGCITEANRTTSRDTSSEPDELREAGCEWEEEGRAREEEEEGGLALLPPMLPLLPMLPTLPLLLIPLIVLSVLLLLSVAAGTVEGLLLLLLLRLIG